MRSRPRYRIFLAVALLCSPAGLLGQQDGPDTRTDPWLADPVSEETFRTYLEFFDYNPELPFDAVVGEATTSQGVTRRHVTYESTPGTRVTAYLDRPGSAGGDERGGVVFLHGGSASGKDSRGYSVMASLLARDGWTVLAIDLLHYGERGTGLLTTYTTEEKSTRLYGEPATYLSFVTQTVKDVSRAYDYLVLEQGVDPERVLLVGRSRGAVLSAIAGAADGRFAGVAMLHGGHFGIMVDEHRPAACPANYIGRISPRPLLLMNTTADAYFLPETTIRPLARLAREPVEVHWTDTPHGFMSDEDRGTLLAWMRRVVE